MHFPSKSESSLGNSPSPISAFSFSQGAGKGSSPGRFQNSLSFLVEMPTFDDFDGDEPKEIGGLALQHVRFLLAFLATDCSFLAYSALHTY